MNSITYDALPITVLQEILKYVGPGHFFPVAWSGREFCAAYSSLHVTQTSLNEVFSSTSVAQWVFREVQGTDVRLYRKLQESYACKLAASQGKLSLLKWLRGLLEDHDNGIEPFQSIGQDKFCSWNQDTCSHAAKNGHLEVLQWAEANGCPWDEWTSKYATENGHLEVLQWAHTNGCPWDRRTCMYAAGSGHLEVLQWLHANGCPWDEISCASAAMNGHLEVLQWAEANGCPWDEMTCAHAAGNGHLEVLQWARVHGCPWDEMTCAHAAGNGHLEVLQWARANECPWE